MAEDVTNIAGVVVPSTSPMFLSVVAVHVAAGLAATVSGALAMLSRKGPGRHPRWGQVYFWSLAATVALASTLALVRWAEDYPLAGLGWASFAAALIARRAVTCRRPGWAPVHLGGMGSSYILMLTAFYVDNGRFLPIWRSLPPSVYWLAPAAVGLPLILLVAARHPLVRRP